MCATIIALVRSEQKRSLRSATYIQQKWKAVRSQVLSTNVAQFDFGKKDKWLRPSPWIVTNLPQIYLKSKTMIFRAL